MQVSLFFLHVRFWGGREKLVLGMEERKGKKRRKKRGEREERRRLSGFATY
jgi:hypothetical protein